MNNFAILGFLRALQQHNSKPWMDQHREEYLEAKAGFANLISQLLAGLQQSDPGLHGVTAAECLFRINKNDFSKKGEPPYKGHFGAGMSPGGRHSPYANYVLVLEPGGKSRAGGGIRKPGAKQLDLIREEIDYSPGELQGILQEPAFYATFGDLRGVQRKSAPKGYGKAHPEIALLRHTGFQVLRYFSDEEVCSPDFINKLTLLYRQVKPLHDFLNRSVTEET
ncbi:DUF2461 domain-containing protein [Pontibacter russatus]|uniref:DUF2461 domain-containing protein n=1 Tax=Pontibacter russatus TaxID=2694929 RepID=UPI00137A7A27|nr:DUF2461 domain-containing protein [Pontibacter russatus]